MRLLKQITTVVFELIFAFSLMSTEAFAQSVNSDSQGGVGIFLATIGLLIALGAISLLIIALRFGSIEISIEEGSCNRTRDGIQDSCAEQSGTVHSCSEKTSG